MMVMDEPWIMGLENQIQDLYQSTEEVLIITIMQYIHWGAS